MKAADCFRVVCPIFLSIVIVIFKSISLLSYYLKRLLGTEQSFWITLSESRMHRGQKTLIVILLFTGLPALREFYANIFTTKLWPQSLLLILLTTVLSQMIRVLYKLRSMRYDLRPPWLCDLINSLLTRLSHSYGTIATHLLFQMSVQFILATKNSFAFQTLGLTSHLPFLLKMARNFYLLSLRWYQSVLNGINFLRMS